MEGEDTRYGCQVALPGFGEAAQEKLKNARVLIVGMGGLGCPAAQYLTAAGAGTIGLADFDVVSESNLHRQILYTPADAGKKKVVVAAQKLQEQNPLIKLVVHDLMISSDNVMNIIGAYDIVVDCTDNFETRYLLNDACVMLGKPVVYGAIYQYEGQVAIWNVALVNGASPNYRDLFPDVDAAQVPNCTTGGVMPTLAGIIGCMQANEVIKWITGNSDLLAGKVLLLDVQTMQSRIIKLGEGSKAGITAIAETETVQLISAPELEEQLDSGMYELVDVRDEAERAAFNIGGQHVPLGQVHEAVFATTKPVVFYCETGKRSKEAVKIAKRNTLGLEAFSLDRGLRAWREQM